MSQRSRVFAAAERYCTYMLCLAACITVYIAGMNHYLAHNVNGVLGGDDAMATINTGYSARGRLSTPPLLPPNPSRPQVVLSDDAAASGKNGTDVPAAESALLMPVSAPVSIVTTLYTGQMANLRRFIGSIHRLRERNYKDLPRIVVYGHGLTAHEQEEISLWWNVHLRMVQFDAADASTDTLVTQSELADTLSALKETVLQDGAAAFIDSSQTVADAIALQRIGSHLDKSGFVLAAAKLARSGGNAAADTAYSTTSSAKLVIRAYHAQNEYFQHQVVDSLNCLRGHNCPVDGSVFVDESDMVEGAESAESLLGGQASPESMRYFCNIQLREDVIYENIGDSSTALNFTDGEVFNKSSHADTIHIGVGVPTTSMRQADWQSSSVLTTFLPGFLQSIRDQDTASRFHFTLYIGYDSGDKFWDAEDGGKLVKSAVMDAIAAHPDNNVSVKFVRLPYSNGWVTFIWNRLYALAMHDGQHYYYQVNDDLVLESGGWAGRLVGMLSANDDFGVAGPFDPKWNCTILTQAMVSRTHWSIFGTFYPVEIKDWYSDFWLSKVYGPEHTYCSSDNRAVNLRDKGTRYTLCNRVNWYEAVVRDRGVVKKWQAAHEQQLQQQQSPQQPAPTTL